MFEFECPCGSTVCSQLGVMGSLVWLRCRACGLDSSVTVEAFMEGEEDDDGEFGDEPLNYNSRDPDREDFHSDG